MGHVGSYRQGKESLNLTSHHLKINLKWIINLNLTAKAIQHLKVWGSPGKTLQNIRTQKFELHERKRKLICWTLSKFEVFLPKLYYYENKKNKRGKSTFENFTTE